MATLCCHYQVILKFEKIINTFINTLQSYNVDTNTIVDEIKFPSDFATNMHVVNWELKQFRIIYDYHSLVILNYQLNHKNGKFIQLSQDISTKFLERGKDKATKVFPKFGLDLDIEWDDGTMYYSSNLSIYLRDNFNFCEKYRGHQTFDTLLLEPSSKIFIISDSQFLIFTFKCSNDGRKILALKSVIIYGIEWHDDQYKIKKQYDISQYIITHYNHIIQGFIIGIYPMIKQWNEYFIIQHAKTVDVFTLNPSQGIEKIKSFSISVNEENSRDDHHEPDDGDYNFNIYNFCTCNDFDQHKLIVCDTIECSPSSCDHKMINIRGSNLNNININDDDNISINNEEKTNAQIFANIVRINDSDDEQMEKRNNSLKSKFILELMDPETLPHMPDDDNRGDVTFMDDYKSTIYHRSGNDNKNYYHYTSTNYQTNSTRFLHIPPNKKEIDERKIIIFNFTKFPNVLLSILIEYLQLDHDLIYIFANINK